VGMLVSVPIIAVAKAVLTTLVEDLRRRGAI
jgi:predicted PurR-regulated permease PerM